MPHLIIKALLKPCALGKTFSGWPKTFIIFAGKKNKVVRIIGPVTPLSPQHICVIPI